MYRLIIADDEESIRNGIAHGLSWQEWGYEVCALCASGEEVLEQLDAVCPDVVLSDIRMPGMDGVELMQRLSPLLYYNVFVCPTTKIETKPLKFLICTMCRSRIIFPCKNQQCTANSAD